MDNDIPGAEKVRLEEGVPSSEQIVRYLFKKDIQSLFIEGGAEVINHFISEGLWDEARIFTGELSFGKGLKAPEMINGSLKGSLSYSKSRLDIFINKGSRSQKEFDNMIKIHSFDI